MMGPQLATLRRSRRRQSGQAAVESALVLPLALFMILGSLQLFMMHQARVMAEYAAFRATRAGSVNHASCQSMNHAAIAALLPTMRDTSDASKLGEAFRDMRDNRFGSGYTTTNQNIENETVVWIYRERPLRDEIPLDEDREFDARFDEPMQLQVTLVFWYPMRIPFADWVIYRMAAASMGIESYVNQNPLILTTKADWQTETATTLNDDILGRMTSNLGADRYLFPIQASYTMRMMTPAKQQYFDGRQHCFST